jgi:uncharacterized RDD family membrane protein YckC
VPPRPLNEGTQGAAPGASAPLLRRLTSVLYEALLLVAVLWLAGLLYSLIEFGLHAAHARSVYQGYLVLTAGIYFVWQWVRGGQTLPMKTWRLKLESRNGAVVTWRQGGLRYVVALAGLAAAGAAFWWALFDRERLFLHDRVAGTRIVRVPA